MSALRVHLTPQQPGPWLLLGLVAVGTGGCLYNPVYRLQVSDFEPTYQPRVHVFAVAPIITLSTEPEAAKAGQAIRKAIYAQMVKRQKEYTTAIQDIAETDRRLRDNGLTDSAAAALPATQVCAILDVDAVMRVKVTYYQTYSTLHQIVSEILSDSSMSIEVSADVAVYDGADGALISEGVVEGSGGMFDSVDEVHDQVGAEIASGFPYTTQRRDHYNKKKKKDQATLLTSPRGIIGHQTGELALASTSARPRN